MEHQTLSLYYIFYTVAKKRNISHAAKELFISQPAISKAIQKLETTLGTTLFNRSSRGVTLTQEGELLYSHLSNAFHEIHTGEEQLMERKQLGIGQVRIGVSTTLCKYMLLPYLKEFIARYPHIKITIDCQSTFHTVNLLEKGDIDIGLIGKPDSAKNLDFYPIQKIEDTFVSTKTYIDNLSLREHTTSYINAEENNFSANEIFKTANLMLLDEENITRHYIDEYFRNHAIEINQVLEVSNMDLLIEFAKIGLGVACVIKEFVEDDLNNGNLVELPLSAPVPKREVGFAYATKSSRSNAVDSFISFYKSKTTI